MIGEFTYANRQGSTVIDYLLLNEKDFHIVSDFDVNSFTQFSDHAPMTLNYAANLGKHSRGQMLVSISNGTMILKPKCADELFRDYLELNRVTSNCSTTRDADSVNRSLNGFTDILREVTDPLFLKQCKTRGQARYSNTSARAASWFDNECLLLKTGIFGRIERVQ